MKKKSSTKIHLNTRPSEQTFGGRTFKELRDLVSNIPDADDPDVFTTKELMAFWHTSQTKTLDMLRALADLGLCEPIYAKRKALHGEVSVKAYRLKGDSEITTP